MPHRTAPHRQRQRGQRQRGHELLSSMIPDHHLEKGVSVMVQVPSYKYRLRPPGTGRAAMAALMMRSDKPVLVFVFLMLLVVTAGGCRSTPWVALAEANRIKADNWQRYKEEWQWFVLYGETKPPREWLIMTKPEKEQWRRQISPYIYQQHVRWSQLPDGRGSGQKGAPFEEFERQFGPPAVPPF